MNAFRTIRFVATSCVPTIVYVNTAVEAKNETGAGKIFNFGPEILSDLVARLWAWWARTNTSA